MEENQMKNCGISRWDDPAEINAKLKNLQTQGIWEVDDDYYENTVLKYYEEKCKESFTLAMMPTVHAFGNCPKWMPTT